VQMFFLGKVVLKIPNLKLIRADSLLMNTV
jgi:hypothetical protein